MNGRPLIFVDLSLIDENEIERLVQMLPDSVFFVNGDPNKAVKVVFDCSESDMLGCIGGLIHGE